MFERFTDRARKVMALANQEAQRFNHEYIGTEHILLGLVKEGSGVGANVLKNLDVDLRKVRLEVEKLVKSGPDMVTMGKLPQTPRAKKVIEYAIEEARNKGVVVVTGAGNDGRDNDETRSLPATFANPEASSWWRTCSNVSSSRGWTICTSIDFGTSLAEASSSSPTIGTFSISPSTVAISLMIGKNLSVAPIWL